MTPGDKKQIIDKMFGFSILNDMQKAIKEERKNIKSDLDAFERELKQISENVISVQVKLNQLLEESDQKSKDKIEELKASLISMNDDKKKLEEAIGKIKKSIGNKVTDLDTSKSSYSKLKYEYEELQRKLKLYEKNACPTCEAPLSTEFHIERKNEIEHKCTGIPDQMKIHEDEVRDIGEEITGLRAKERQVLDRVSGMNVSIESLKSELLKIKSSLSDNKEFDHLKQIIQDFENKEAEKDNQKAALNSDYNFLEAIESVLGEDGVKNLAIKTILPGLNANIAAMAATMHLPFHIRFDEKFDCIINHLGENINPMTLSTGERKKADFIVIIAIIKILKLRFPQLNLLFLDELLSSVDQDGIYNILKILSQVIKESKINTFVINHTVLPHEMFDKKIHIYKENGFSRFDIESIE
jgi:DNA repair exonuclease SbcCD ATPase subunit